MSVWLINAKPFEDELLSSWLIRTAIANGDDPIGLTQKTWSEWRAWTMDFDRQCPDEKIQQLSKVSGLTEHQLINMTLQPVIVKVLTDQSLKLTSRWPWVISTGRRNRTAVNGLHFCPDCLSDSPIYFKKSWRFAWNVACSKHKKLLSISCPSCNTVISPHLVTYDSTNLSECTHCGFNLKEITTSRASDEVIQFQELLNRSINQFKVSEIGIPSDIENIEELFGTTLFLMKFFYSLRRYPKPYQYLIDSLGLTEESIRCPSSSGGVIETLSVEFRYFLLLATSRVLSLDLKDIVQLLQDAEVSQQRLSVGGNTTKYIERIQSNLIDNPIKRKSRTTKQEVILPRSKEEVERIMNEEIRPYL